MAPRSPLRRALDLAAEQYGVIGRQQILDCGLTAHRLRRAVQAETLDPIHRAVFKATGSASSWHQHLMAAILAGGSDAVASHRSTAALFELDSFPKDVVEISVSQELRVYRRPI